MIGAQTIGNATLIAYDQKPILSTDPWMGGDHFAYFGSWHLPYDIPENLNKDILSSKYIWFSHGHPDHINPDSLHLFKNNNILLSDHVGSRIYEELKKEKFKVTLLKDRQWVNLSDNISILSIATKIQDSILLIRIKDDIFINLNDAGPNSFRFIRKKISSFKRKFLLTLSGWGDADMINFYDQDDKFIQPLAAKKNPVGESLSLMAKLFGAQYVIPFSSFHEYQREDSVWANKYITQYNDYSNGIHKDITFIKPFTFVDSTKKDEFFTLEIKKKELNIKSPDVFGDNWNDSLDLKDSKIIENYFSKFELLKEKIGFINFRVGKKDFNLKFRGPKKRGISFELPRNSLVTACKYNIFDDLLIGNYMKTKLYNLKSLYDPNFNFAFTVSKFGDNGKAYTKEEINNYLKSYAERMGREYLFDIFASHSKEYFKFFFKNYYQSKYYSKIKKMYYFLLK
jgi:hypothetical protein